MLISFNLSLKYPEGKGLIPGLGFISYRIKQTTEARRTQRRSYWCCFVSLLLKVGVFLLVVGWVLGFLSHQ